MDAVILAAGKGERLFGHVPAYHKPLLIVNGRSLVMGAIESVTEIVDGNIVVVVAPENAHPIVSLMRDSGWNENYRIIIQPMANGPGRALALASEICYSDRIVILCGDNVVRSEDVKLMSDGYSGLVAGIRLLEDADIARSFTLFSPEGEAIEKPADAEYLRWPDGSFRVWLGPLCVSKKWLGEQDKLELIGPRLSNATLVEVDSYDIGIPEVLP